MASVIEAPEIAELRRAYERISQFHALSSQKKPLERRIQSEPPAVRSPFDTKEKSPFDTKEKSPLDVSAAKSREGSPERWPEWQSQSAAPHYVLSCTRKLILFFSVLRCPGVGDKNVERNTNINSGIVTKQSRRPEASSIHGPMSHIVDEDVKRSDASCVNCETNK